MTEKQKNEVAIMRRAGYGYTDIAEKLDISVNTVKSHCKRHGLGAKNMSIYKSRDVLGLRHCKQCGVLLEQQPKRKEKKFCSDACRNKWWNEHQILVNKEAYYEIICLGCGVRFKSYGNKKRKYCSHECYIKHRFEDPKTHKTDAENIYINSPANAVESDNTKPMYTKEEWEHHV